MDRYLDFLSFVVSADLSRPANYAKVIQDLDPVDFADYIIYYSFYAVGDWPDNNWTFIMGNGANPLPGRFLAWDAEKAWLEYSDEQANKHAWYSPWLQTSSGSDYQPTLKRIWLGMIRNADFRRLFADRAYQHTHHDGVLSDPTFKARFDAYKDKLDLAIRADQMRWTSDTRGQFPNRMFTHDDWQDRIDRVRSNTQDNVTEFINAFRSKGLYPAINPPEFNQRGGDVAPGFQATLSAGTQSGTIYYTLDGTDPQLSEAEGGGLNPSAIAYSEPIAVSGVVEVKARLRNGSTWSALNHASFNGDLATLEDLIVDYFDIDSFQRQGSAFSENWLGNFEAKNFPWVNHDRLGWLYGPGDEQEWIYVVDLGWIWTDENIYPAIWNHDLQTWLFFLTESGSEKALP